MNKINNHIWKCLRITKLKPYFQEKEATLIKWNKIDVILKIYAEIRNNKLEVKT